MLVYVQSDFLKLCSVFSFFKFQAILTELYHFFLGCIQVQVYFGKGLCINAMLCTLSQSCLSSCGPMLDTSWRKCDHSEDLIVCLSVLKESICYHCEVGSGLSAPCTSSVMLLGVCCAFCVQILTCMSLLNSPPGCFGRSIRLGRYHSPVSNAFNYMLNELV